MIPGERSSAATVRGSLIKVTNWYTRKKKKIMSQKRRDKRVKDREKRKEIDHLNIKEEIK